MPNLISKVMRPGDPLYKQTKHKETDPSTIQDAEAARAYFEEEEEPGRPAY